MTEIKAKASEVPSPTKPQARCAAVAPTYRTILIAACMGVLIGLLLKR